MKLLSAVTLIALFVFAYITAGTWLKRPSPIKVHLIKTIAVNIDDEADRQMEGK